MPKKENGSGAWFGDFFKCSVAREKQIEPAEEKQYMNEIEFEMAVDAEARERFGGGFTEQQHTEVWSEMKRGVELKH